MDTPPIAKSKELPTPTCIGILGAFGTGNTGNEGTLQATIAFIQKLQPNARIVCICPAPNKVRAYHRIGSLSTSIRSPNNCLFRNLSKVLLKVPGAIVDVIRAARRARSLRNSYHTRYRCAG